MRKHLLPLFLVLTLLAVLSFAALQTDKLHRARYIIEEINRRALNESAGEMQRLTLSLEKMLVSNHPAQQNVLLREIIRSSSDIAQQLAALPIPHTASAAAMQFTAQLWDDAAAMLTGTVDKGLSSQDRDRLYAALATAAQLAAQLSLVQAQPLTLTPEESVFSADADPARRAADFLFSDVNYPIVSTPEPKLPRALPEGEVSREEARAVAAAVSGAAQVSDASDVFGTLPAYGFSAVSDGVQLNMEITRRGGKLLWMMPETASFPVTQTPASCEEAALEFLLQQGFGPARIVHRQIYDGLCVLSAVPIEDDILLYPDLLVLQVRMDTLQVVALEGRSYWTNHTKRNLTSPTISAAQAAQQLSSQADCTAQQLCLIPEGNDEILCWQCTVHRDGDTFFIYIDAHDGREVAIRKLIPLENGTTAA